MQIKEVGTKYDYSDCNHPQYNIVSEEIEKLTAKRKSLEKYLQSLTEEEEYINPKTGEICTIYPPSKTSTPSVVITINK